MKFWSSLPAGFGFSSLSWGWSCIKRSGQSSSAGSFLSVSQYQFPLFWVKSLRVPWHFLTNCFFQQFCVFYLWIFLLSYQSWLGSSVSQVHHCLLALTLRASFVMLRSGMGPRCTCWCLLTLRSARVRLCGGKSSFTAGRRLFLLLKYLIFLSSAYFLAKTARRLCK